MTVGVVDVVGKERMRPEIATLGALSLILVLFYPRAIGSMIQIWWETTTYQHGFLVLPISLWLAWRRRDELARHEFAPAATALLPLALFALVGLLGSIAGINLFRHVGFVGMLMAMVPLCLGWGVARAFWFPILFLSFMVPVGDFLIAPLQEITADASVWMLQVTGIPVYREGLMIELPTGLWEVAEACAGLRFIVANLFVAAVFAYFSYDRAWKWAVFIVLAVAIPVGANCVRAYGIMLVAHLTDNTVAAGVDHLVYGWVFFSMVMILMLWVGGFFADRHIEDPKVEPSKAAPRRARFPAIGASFLLVAPAAAVQLMAAAPSPLPDDLMARVTPAGWEQVAIDPDADDAWNPRFASADGIAHRRFERGGAMVDVFIAAYSHQRGNAEVTHWANRFDDNELWTRARLSEIALDTGGSGLPSTARLDEMTHYVMTGDHRGTEFSTRIVASWMIVGDRFTSGGKEAKLAELAARVTGGSQAAAVLAFSVQFDRPYERQEAVAALELALSDLQPVAGFLNAER